MKALAAVLLLSRFAIAAEPAVPGAVIGTFHDKQRVKLITTLGKEGLSATLDGADLGAARWTGKALIAGGQTFVAVEDKGRLVLASSTDRPFVRQVGSPWWQLQPDTRADFIKRLNSFSRQEWMAPDFYAWYKKIYEGTPVGQATATSEWRFNHLDRRHRESLLALYAKMKAEDVWQYVNLITWSGESGEMNFFTSGTDAALMAGLAARGYADVFGASDPFLAKYKDWDKPSEWGKVTPWGVRKLRAGVELHIKNAEHDNALSHVHIDFFNPTTKAEAVIHVIKDLKQWDEVHTNEEVLKKVEEQGKKQGYTVERSPD